MRTTSTPEDIGGPVKGASQRRRIIQRYRHQSVKFKAKTRRAAYGGIGPLDWQNSGHSLGMSGQAVGGREVKLEIPPEIPLLDQIINHRDDARFYRKNAIALRRAADLDDSLSVEAEARADMLSVAEPIATPVKK
jgi:hypothetical protein